MIKAVFFDIDGTLVSFNTHRVSDKTIKALLRLKASGVRLFIASGRHRCDMDKIDPVAHLFDGFVQVNGGLCTIGDKVVHSVTIKQEDVHKWLEYINATPHSTCFVMRDKTIMNFADEKMVELFKVLDFPQPETDDLNKYADEPLYQMMISFSPDQDEIILPMFPDCYAPRWSDLFSDIIPNGVNKANGIRAILAHEGIDIKDAIAFGDGGNDIEMLTEVGIGIAMGSAPQEVKDAADRITSDVDSEGVAREIENLYKEGIII